MIRIATFEENKEGVIRWLKLDPVRQFWEIYDLTSEPEKCIFWIGYDNSDSPKGSLSLFRGLPVPIARLNGECSVAKELLNCLPREKITLYFPKSLHQIVKKRFPEAEYRPSLDCQMYLAKGTEYLFSPELAKKLTHEHACILVELYALVRPGELVWTTPYRDEESCKKLLNEQTVYGVFRGDKIISTATIRKIKDFPEIGLISSLFTHPEHRRKGYGTIVISAATKDIFENGQWATLYVRKTNIPAIALYKKLGYKKLEEWWGVTIF